MSSKLTILALFIFIIAIIIVMLGFYQSKFQNKKSFKDLSDREFISIKVGDAEEITVEVVSSASSTQQGLSGRDSIGSDGMLFIFPETSQRVFWMFDMKLDLDLIWIDGDKIVGITKNVEKPEPGIKREDIELISINKNSDKVLELNAGDVDRYGIEVGDVVIIK